MLDRGRGPREARQRALHAYVGADPFAGRDASRRPSLGRVARPLRGDHAEPGGSVPGDAGRRCAAARAVAEALAGSPDYGSHPYPVTPYHADYLQHADLVADGERARPRRVGRSSASRRARASRRRGARPAGAAVRRGRLGRRGRDGGRAVVGGDRAWGSNGWLGAPGLKEGWFHAYLVLRDGVGDPREPGGGPRPSTSGSRPARTLPERAAIDARARAGLDAARGVRAHRRRLHAAARALQRRVSRASRTRRTTPRPASAPRSSCGRSSSRTSRGTAGYGRRRRRARRRLESGGRLHRSGRPAPLARARRSRLLPLTPRRPAGCRTA